MCYREHQNRSRGTTSLLLSRPQLMQLTIQSHCAIAIRAQLYFALSARTDNHAPPLGQGALSDDARLTSVCRVHRA